MFTKIYLHVSLCQEVAKQNVYDLDKFTLPVALENCLVILLFEVVLLNEDLFQIFSTISVQFCQEEHNLN